jgi:hypothetical protein
MSYLRSTTLAVFCSLAVIGLSGHLAPANADTGAAAAKKYAENASATVQQEMAPARAIHSTSLEQASWANVVISHKVGGCGLRCRAGMPD